MTNIDVSVEVFKIAQACQPMAGVNILRAEYSHSGAVILTNNTLVDYLLVNQIPYTVEPWDYGDSTWTHELTARVGGVTVHTLLSQEWLEELKDKEANYALAV